MSAKVALLIEATKFSKIVNILPGRHQSKNEVTLKKMTHFKFLLLVPWTKKVKFC